MKIAIIINTYNRPDMLSRLLQSINDTRRDTHDIFLHIYEDRSDANYDAAIKLLHDTGIAYRWIKSPFYFSKKRYWQLMDFIYADMQDQEYDYLVQLPDDVRLVPNFFDIAIDSYDAITDKYCICLNILSDSRAGKQMWTNVQPHKAIFDGLTVWCSGWMDMCIIADSRYLQALEYSINTVPQSWAHDMTKSTGVGMQISQRLAQNYNLYQVTDSLVIHDEHASQMHPGEIKGCTNHITPTYDLTDKEIITAGVASIPSRIDSLQETIQSILPQVDIINVYLNEYPYVPAYLQHEKIRVYLSDKEMGDIGDAGKFYMVDQARGYYFSIDDDIIYPCDYVETMIQAVEDSGRGLVATLHGRIFDRFPITKYYKGHAQAFRCLDPQYRDEYIHVPGTGVTCFHTDTIQPKLEDFEVSNMADVWMGLLCQQKKIPVLCLKHKKGWIKLSKKYDEGNSIYSHLSGKDTMQVHAMNRVKKWIIYKPKKTK